MMPLPQIKFCHRHSPYPQMIFDSPHAFSKAYVKPGHRKKSRMRRGPPFLMRNGPFNTKTLLLSGERENSDPVPCQNYDYSFLLCSHIKEIMLIHMVFRCGTYPRSPRDRTYAPIPFDGIKSLYNMVWLSPTR